MVHSWITYDSVNARYNVGFEDACQGDFNFVDVEALITLAAGESIHGAIGCHADVDCTDQCNTGTCNTNSGTCSAKTPKVGMDPGT